MKFTFQSTLCKFYNVKLPVNKRNRNFVRFLYSVNEKNIIPYSNLTKVNETVIEDKLKSLSVPFTCGYTCFQVKDCNLCSKSKTWNSSEPSLYINKKTGFFLCNNCKITGSWCTFDSLLKKCKNDPKSLLNLEEEGCMRFDKPPDNWINVVKSTSLLCDLKEPNYGNVFTYFKLPYCVKELVKSLKVRVNASVNLLYFPLFFELKVIGYITYDIHGNVNTWPMSGCPGFLLSPKKGKPVVVVAKIPDFLVLLNEKIPYQILCLPYGISSLPQNLLPFLESYNKLILWLGGASALDSCSYFAKKLNESRCFMVRPTQNQVTPVTAFVKKEDINQILSGAKPTWHPFVTTFSSFREEVLAEFQNPGTVVGVPWKRYKGLNRILKGHRRGELTILTGPTGSGKTTFVSEYSLDLAMQGVNTLWGSFEIKNTRLVKMMIQQYAGVSLEENVGSFNAWADGFERLPIFFMTFYGHQPLSKVMDTVEHCYYTYDIAHVIIDNVQFMLDVSYDSGSVDRFWKQDSLINAFRNFASKGNCHVTLVMHPRKEIDGIHLGISSVFGGAKATQEADNVIIIQSSKQYAGEGRTYLEVCKNRFAGDLGVIPLEFNKSCLSFSQRNSEPRRQEVVKPVESQPINEGTNTELNFRNVKMSSLDAGP